MKNKKLLYSLLFSLICIFTITYTLISIICFNNRQKYKKTNFDPTKDKNHKYLVKGDSGKINIFENGEKTPIKTIEQEVEYLPEYDRQMLENGIYAESAEQLDKILEDYGD